LYDCYVRLRDIPLKHEEGRGVFVFEKVGIPLMKIKIFKRVNPTFYKTTLLPHPIF